MAEATLSRPLARPARSWSAALLQSRGLMGLFFMLPAAAFLLVFLTYPLLTPIIAVVMTFSVLFTFTDFQLIWAMTRGGPVNATHLMATLSYQRGILGGRLGEGAAIATAMVPFLLAAIMVSWFGLQRRKWQHGEDND